MTSTCDMPIADETMVDYWSGGLPPQQSEAIEEHVFSCAACAARLEAVAAMAAGITSLARQGRFSGIISRATLNQLQRDGVRVRVYSLSPGDVVPCAVFPDDDLVVTSMRGDFAGVDAVTRLGDRFDAAVGHRPRRRPGVGGGRRAAVGGARVVDPADADVAGHADSDRRSRGRAANRRVRPRSHRRVNPVTSPAAHRKLETGNWRVVSRNRPGHSDSSTQSPISNSSAALFQIR